MKKQGYTLSALQRQLKVSFKRRHLLEHALTHSSYKYELINQAYEAGNEHKEYLDNERLEFFGDAILSFVICKTLFCMYPDLDEGKLSKYRSLVVSRKLLCTIAKKLKLHHYLYLGRGEHNIPFREKTKMMADALEAIIAAIYLDRGITITENFIQKHFASYLTLTRLRQLDSTENYKNKLQESCQREFLILPRYKTAVHKEEFKSTVYIRKKAYGVGVGRSKRSAEKEAAKATLTLLRAKKRKKKK